MDISITEQQQKELLKMAREVITEGCQLSPPQLSTPPPVDIHNLPESYQTQAASFVTLHKQNQLRGCIGSLKAYRPLMVDVLENAFASAFKDPRFPPVSETELPALHVEISILTPQQPMGISTEAELLQSLRPNIDGLVIQDGRHSATFLPQVWEQLSEPKIFLQHLKQKAGLARDYWSDDMQCFRYQCIKFQE